MRTVCIILLALLGLMACSREPVSQTVAYQAPVAAKPTQDQLDRAAAKVIDEKIRAAEIKQFCTQFKDDKGCTSDTCVMSTDDSGRCIVYKRVPGNICQNSKQCSVGEMCLIENPKLLTGKCVKIK